MSGSLGRPVNRKLGTGIYSWSIPEGETCPGESSVCSSVCYVKRGYYAFPANKRFLQKNLKWTKDPTFARWMLAELRKYSVKVLRVHVAGDFYDAEYTQKWLGIIQQARGVQFYAYTRSWRVEEIYPLLISLAQLPNLRLWFSCDRETGLPPDLDGVGKAYLAINDIDAWKAPKQADLVFRHNPRTKLKRANKVLVCPAENKIEGKLRHTCTSCQLCWRPDGLALLKPLPLVETIDAHLLTEER